MNPGAWSATVSFSPVPVHSKMHTGGIVPNELRGWEFDLNLGIVSLEGGRFELTIGDDVLICENQLELLDAIQEHVEEKLGEEGRA